MFELRKRGYESRCISVKIWCCASANVSGDGLPIASLTFSRTRASKLTWRNENVLNTRYLVDDSIIIYAYHM